ncbi:hypothetical protein SERLADRAFT_444897 [Serpula lacrymans var. lacrymans S7.9]|uniref:Carbohydrate kinase PfkB domain-containing protein n=1 Tax=Serpula lacrymans var. lacrymans (strain S7.9) TaxID=578457 RepID=F8NI83_SERL9|nr:uncharacterized protein SERLADRAFT_444897 [Serpula lacrymans var. lacrymans S7.9]EGO28980.1 hypothetical protein SERLADRAFT_444897 [Serpula lacrymans var. lacrymans S7.9]
MFQNNLKMNLAQALRKQAPIDIHPEVEDALGRNIPVVALESTIISHGMPYPTSLETAQSLESIVRSTGSVPATIALIGGRIKIGLQPLELEYIADTTANPNITKLSRRDIAPAISMKRDGATTCSATLIFAALAGIKVFATGGLGGVHRGGERTMDVSADLQELTRCPVGLVSAGVKSILDIGRTLEYLETLGVPVLTYGQTNDFPGFYTARSGFKTPWRVNDAGTAATVLHTQWKLGMTNGVLFAAPIPEEYEAAGLAIQQAVERAISEAEDNGIHKSGKEVTPWLLKRVGEITGGKSLASNVALVRNTALIGGQIAVEYAKLERYTTAQDVQLHPVAKLSTLTNLTIQEKPVYSKTEPSPSLIVVGCAAVDITSQPYVHPDSNSNLGLHSTSPGKVSISLGGVGRNISEAAHRIMSSQSPDLSSATMLMSPVGSDPFGRLLMDETRMLGMRTDGLIANDEESSAVCNMLVDASGNLKEGVADMDITCSLDGDMVVRYLETYTPKVLAVDGNLSETTLTTLVDYCSQKKLDIFFEPTSVMKSTNILSAIAEVKDLTRSPVTFASPNILELCRIYHEVRSPSWDLMSSEAWWRVIDGFGLGSAFRMDLEKLARMDVSKDDPRQGTLSFLISEGIAQMAINLLPFFEKLVIKCGERGVIVAMRLSGHVVETLPWISATNSFDARRVIARSMSSREMVVLQHFPALHIDKSSIINVTGAGDSLVGSLLATLVSNPKAFESPKSLKDMVDKAQQAAVLTLQSSASVSPLLSAMSASKKTLEL